MAPTTGDPIIDMFVALIAAIGSSKSVHILWRRYANGKTAATEPVSKRDMEELLQPLYTESKQQNEYLKDIVRNQANVGTAVNRLATVLEERLPPAWVARPPA